MMYAWLNLESGKFSNSWTEEEHKKYLNDGDIVAHTKQFPTWKLIRFECVNDKGFMFTNHMKLR